ncbi:MAG: LamG domain-containing protein [Phaeodactylibacter sp.]|nr:LamG domain-containing protein [Phaeodactylibacter sp.]MCB9294411.1 LamG domain-containing protein [Lewinellaceae bacterium]
MKAPSSFLHSFFLALAALALPGPAAAQPCPNRALDFDGVDDRVILSPGPVTGDSDFTFEAWFTCASNNPPVGCSGNFRRLFSLSGPGNTRFEFGECGGNMGIFVSNGSSVTGPFVINSQNVRDGQWHCTVVRRQGNTITAYLDGAQIWVNTLAGAYNFDQFRLGSWGGGITPNELWQGTIDEVRLWNIALASPLASTCDNCLLPTNDPGLVLYWQMDQGMPGMNNTAITSIQDDSGNSNAGIPTGFALNGPTSNFVCSGANFVYPDYNELELAIRDLPTQTVDLQEICNGDPAHFCLSLPGGSTPTLAPGTVLEWQYRDGGGAWNTITNPAFFGLCFPLLPGNLTIDCAANTDGFVERQYRAKITVTDPMLGPCEYHTPPYDLKICCPISPATIDVMPTNLLCEGETVTFNASLNSPDPFVMTPGPDVTIDWFFDGTPISSGNPITVMHTFTAPLVTMPTEFAFTVEITNCGGKMETFASVPITVDPEPVCGSIVGLDMPPNLTLAATTPHLIYEICPGDDAAVGQDPTDPFMDCNPQWQYAFSETGPWINMGFSNTVQNTNILPTGSWTGTSIFYRVSCLPLSDPSGCDPCESNIIEITLKEPPPADVIVGDDQICKGDFSLLNVSSPMTGFDYTWFCNGLEVGTGTSLMASQPANYWVEISNGCQVVESAWFELEVCEIIPVISCPLPPNTCAVLGTPIQLSACLSESNCGSLDFFWVWTDAGGMTQTSTNCQITDTPPAGGTTYQVTITEPGSGCSVTTSTFVQPCLKF